MSDVAAQVGIDNIKNLSRQFKQAMGCTPQEYRKQFEQQQNHDGNAEDDSPLD